MSCTKCQSKVMLRLEDMSEKEVNYLKLIEHSISKISSNSLLIRSYLLNVTSLWPEIVHNEKNKGFRLIIKSQFLWENMHLEE